MNDVSDFITGHRVLDEQHLHLLNIMEYYNVSCDINDSMGIDRIFDLLTKYVEFHFKYEEQLFQDIPEFADHVNFHKTFSSRIQEFKERFDESDCLELRKEFYGFLRNWLIDHICREDKKAVGWLEKNQPHKIPD